MTLSRSTFLKPGSSNASLYVPDGMPGNRYVPSASVTVVRTPISDGDVAVTVTPGSTAPCCVGHDTGETALANLCVTGDAQQDMRTLPGERNA